MAWGRAEERWQIGRGARRPEDLLAKGMQKGAPLAQTVGSGMMRSRKEMEPVNLG